jgi:hypothetical protein
VVSARVIRKKDQKVFDGFAQLQLNIGDFALNQVADDYRAYLIDNWLRGQALGVRTGETVGSVKLFRYKKKKGQWAVRPGVGIRGSMNYLLIFERGGGEVVAKSLAGLRYQDEAGNWYRKLAVRLKSRPFMRPSFRAYIASKRYSQIVKRIYDAMAKKILGVEGGAK